MRGRPQSSIARIEAGRTSPSFELVQQMLRQCGFSLVVQLDAYDSDIAQAEQNLRRSINGRLDSMYADIEFAAELADTHIGLDVAPETSLAITNVRRVPSTGWRR